MVINWPKLAPNPLVTFFASQGGNLPDACYTYCDNGTLYRWDASGNPSSLKGAITIRSVNRVIFPDNSITRGAFLVGFNVIGTDAESQAKFKPGSLELASAIRCFLQATNDITDRNFGEKVDITLNFDVKRMTHFWMSHAYQYDGNGRVDLLAPNGGASPKTLKGAVSDLSSGKTSPLYLGHLNNDGSGGLAGSDDNKIFTEWSRVLRGLINFEPGKSSVQATPEDLPEDLKNVVNDSERSLCVSFLETEPKSGQFVLQFEAQFEKPPIYDGVGLLKCFAIAPFGQEEGQARFDLVDEPSNGYAWYFRQRSSVVSCQVSSRQELISQFEWVLELSCLTHKSVASHAYDWVQTGIQGIRGFAGATGASFLPLLVTPDTGVGLEFSAVYLIADQVMERLQTDTILYDPSNRQKGKTEVYPFSVEYIGPRARGSDTDATGSVVLQFPLCESIDRSPLEVNAVLTSPSLVTRESHSGFVFTSIYPLSGPQTPVHVRMGSLEVGFGQRVESGVPNTPSYFYLFDQGTGSGPQLTASALFTITKLLPGGQDDLPEDSFFAPNAVASAMRKCRTGAEPFTGITNLNPDQKEDIEVEQLFYRPRPLLINRAQSNNDVPLVLTVAESSGPSVNRTAYLSLDVDTKSQVLPPLSSGKQQTIVLDSDPFLVAQLTFPSLLSQAGNAHIAVWDNSSGNGAKWQIPLTKSGFSLSLPALALGEEMIKNKDFVLPAEFRIGTPTVVAMETGGQYTAFAEVPWNLRRILEYDGQTPGVSVDRLDYELIYGLSCDVSQPFIRLAEVFALLGAIPGRLPEILSARDPHFDAIEYRQWRGEWGNLHQRYQSRLAILEPWDSHESGSLTLKHGMSCMIRYDVNKAQPKCTQTLGKVLPQFAPDDSTEGRPFRLPYADLEDPIMPTDRTPTAPLRGGVTWGFESRNIFCATLSNEFSTTDSAAVSGLDMTALGGFGHQQASFDTGRTSIFADVAMGRTYHYRLERVGRVGVLWNKAKHVIVYERSVVPSRQFYLEQDDPNAPTSTYGTPILRKVQEYVEILEEQRAFPDDHQVATAAPTPPPANATPAQRCGCIAGTVFQKGARFPVSSSWGSDVYSNRDGSGTAIGWKVPLWKRNAQPPDVYPFPKVTLSVMSNFGGSSKESPCDVANPENVFFYTDTRPNTGSDSDQWVAIVGIDTIDLAPLKPPQTSGGPSTLPAVGDVAIPAGFSPCTFTLLPPLQPADIVASRNGPPMAAVLDSVTMMRGYVGQSPPTAESLASILSAYSGAWEKELNAIGPSDWNKANLQALAGRISSQLTQPVKDIQTKVQGAWAQWQDKVNAYNKSSVARFINQLLTASDDGKTLAGGLNQVKQDVIAALNSIPDDPASLRQLIDEQFAQIQHAVISASASPGGLSLLLQQYYRAATGIVNTATTGIKNLQSAGTATLAELTKQVLDLRTTLQSIWQSAGSSSPLPSLTDIGAMLAQVPLNNLVTQYNNLIQSLTDSVSSGDLNTVKAAIAKLTAPDNKVTNELNTFAQLLLLDLTSADDTLVTYLDCFRNSLVQVDQSAAGVNNWATKAYQQLVIAANANKAAVQKAFEDAQTGIYATFNAELTDLQNKLSQEVSSLGDKYKKLYGQGATQLTDLLNGIVATGAENLSQLNSLLQQALQNLPDSIGIPVGGVINPQDVATLQQAVLAFRDQQFGQVHQFVDKYLNLIRGSVADVTASTNQYLSLIRAFGDAPVANTLSFLPGKIGYYFQQAGLPTQVDLSPVTSILRQAGSIASDASGLLNNALNVMHLQIPTQSLANRLVPFDLSKLKLSDIFPKFGGIDLSGLFRDINLGENGDKIQITHGTDPQTMSAWVQAKVGAHFDDVPIFDTGDIALRFASADFNGQVKVDVSPQGTQQLASGNVTGDWTLLVMGQQAVTLSATQLLFDSTGNFHFIVDPRNVKLPGVLDFVSQYLTPFLTGNNGLSIQIHGTQINALLSLPIPDVSGVTSGISNLRLSCLLGLGLNANNQFQLDVGFGLSDPQRPFNIAFFILGGAGYLMATTHVVPATSEISVSVDFGIMASASLAVAFGPISGGVYAFLGITAGFKTGGPGLNLSAVLLMRGQVNLAGIISASVCMQLSVGDQAGKVTGTGSFSISVSICWCFTLNISVDISYSIGSFGGAKHASLELPTANPVLLAELEPGPLDPRRAAWEPAAWYADPIDDLTKFVNDYVAMTPGA